MELIIILGIQATVLTVMGITLRCKRNKHNKRVGSILPAMWQRRIIELSKGA